MTTERFRAGVQYDDWRGTAAADNADKNDLASYLEERGLFDRGREFILGVNFSALDYDVDEPFIHVIIADQSGYDDTSRWLRDQRDPIPVKRVTLEMPLVDFLRLFKRLDVVMTNKDLELEGREFRYED